MNERRLTTDAHVYRRSAQPHTDQTYHNPAGRMAERTKWHVRGCMLSHFLPADDESMPARLTQPEDRCRSCLWRLPTPIYYCEEGDMVTVGKGGMALHARATGHCYFDGPRVVEVPRGDRRNRHRWLNT